jgi:hypothetical protein
VIKLGYGSRVDVVITDDDLGSHGSRTGQTRAIVVELQYLRKTAVRCVLCRVTANATSVPWYDVRAGPPQHVLTAALRGITGIEA